LWEAMNSTRSGRRSAITRSRKRWVHIGSSPCVGSSRMRIRSSHSERLREAYALEIPFESCLTSSFGARRGRAGRWLRRRSTAPRRLDAGQQRVPLERVLGMPGRRNGPRAPTCIRCRTARCTCAGAVRRSSRSRRSGHMYPSTSPINVLLPAPLGPASRDTRRRECRGEVDDRRDVLPRRPRYVLLT
jgi:hypothetical protein